MNDKLHEELTAYLDGELDADRSRALEEQLVHDPACRKELERLERAWSLLDRLPRSAASESFGRTTLELVALNATQELDAIRAATPVRQRRRWAVAAAAAIVCASAGYFGGRAVWPDPNRQLTRDLPILENLDLYQDAEDIHFLERLDESRLFADDRDAT